MKKKSNHAELLNELIGMGMEQLRSIQDVRINETQFRGRLAKADVTFKGISSVWKAIALHEKMNTIDVPTKTLK